MTVIRPEKTLGSAAEKKNGCVASSAEARYDN